VTRTIWRAVALALIFLFIGAAVATATYWVVPAPGSAPSIFDDFKWSSTANGYWHVNPVGGTAIIKHSILTLKGTSIELDRRLQTDPDETVVVIKLRALHFHRFGVGLGIYHAGTLGLEFDDDGVKCGRGTDHGYNIAFMQTWKVPPVNQWFYLTLDVVNPYPGYKHMPSNSSPKLKRVKMTCAIYDQNGRLLKSVTPTNPPPNAHYIGLDEAYIRTWDSGNEYQIDWIYAGPPSGNPAQALLKGPGPVTL
jgi:hypothetical protein